MLEAKAFFTGCLHRHSRWFPKQKINRGFLHPAYRLRKFAVSLCLIKLFIYLFLSRLTVVKTKTENPNFFCFCLGIFLDYRSARLF